MKMFDLMFFYWARHSPADFTQSAAVTF